MSDCENRSPHGQERVVWLDDSGAHARPPVEKVLSIENVAEMFAISTWTLRQYEFRGLIKRRQRIGPVWVYSWADCDRIAFLIKCRKAGLGFAKVAAIIRATDSDSALVHECAQERCMELVERLEEKRRAVDEALSELGHVHSLLTAKIVGEGYPGRRR